MQGIHSIYKPKGPSSHDLINQLRKITGIKTIGHAGTLDPFASGVLVVGIAKWATKKLDKVVKEEKEYLAKIKLGEESTTLDQEGEKKPTFASNEATADKKVEVKEIPSLEKVKKVVLAFKGRINQVPPYFSALKIKGKKAYELARKGKKPYLKPRRVEIKEIKIIKYKWPYLKLKVICGPGTYIRSLARDIGKKLKTGGYLASLERRRVGKFIKEKSYTLAQFKKEYEKRKIIQTLCLVVKENKILLGLKKRGFGDKRWNGFGGKLEGKESMEKATKRELKEEAGIEALKLKKRAVFTFEFKNAPDIIEAHLFECIKYNGEPHETEEMKPKWFDFEKIPYKKMWPDDTFWLPLFLKGKKLRGEFYFKDHNTLLYHSLREVKNI